MTAKYGFFKKIDRLPTGPEWHYDDVLITGDIIGPDGKPLTEEAELWRRDAVDCTADLMGNPAFRDNIAYEPVKIMRDGQRYYGEMNSGKWWYKVQVRTIMDFERRRGLNVSSLALVPASGRRHGGRDCGCFGPDQSDRVQWRQEGVAGVPHSREHR